MCLFRMVWVCKKKRQERTLYAIAYQTGLVLGVEEPIVERFPDNPIVSIVAYIGTSQLAPGRIKMVGDESLVVGNYLPSPVNANKQIDEFVELLRKGGCTVQRVDDVERVRWQKLFWNGAFSPVCAISRMNTTEILASEQAMTTVKKLMSEVIQAANAMGYEYNIEEQMAAMIERTRATAMDYKVSREPRQEIGSSCSL